MVRCAVAEQLFTMHIICTHCIVFEFCGMQKEE